MGFGFSLLLIFILLPLSVLFIIIWAIKRDKIYGLFLGYLWIGLFTFVALIHGINILKADKVLTKKSYYGNYVIDRNYFKGRQADWQYESFRFEIKKNDSIFFHVTDGERILKNYKGTISTSEPANYVSDRLKLHMEQPTIHILKTNPTIYRSAWGFHLVFYSEKFNNMYFRKKSWKE